MKHDKSWSFDQIVKLKKGYYHDPQEVRVGVRDLSIITADDKENIRFRKCKEGLEIRVYSRRPLVKMSEFKECDMGHKHQVVSERQFCWLSMTIPVAVLGQFQEWLTDGHYKWKC